MSEQNEGHVVFKSPAASTTAAPPPYGQVVNENNSKEFTGRTPPPAPCGTFQCSYPYPAPPIAHQPMTGIRSGTQILPQTGMMTPAGMFVPPNGYTPMMIFREEPVKLGDGTYTEVRFVNGEFARMIMILLFVALLPFGLFFLALLPLCMTCKKIQDAEHIDPVTGNTVGVFRRGYPDAPSFYHFYRYPKGTEPEQTSNATITVQPIPQQIAFRDRPVLLPDGNTTILRRRLGATNIAWLCIIYWSVCWLFLCPLGFLALFARCCMDIEHIHPITGEVVGVYYRSNVNFYDRHYYGHGHGHYGYGHHHHAAI